MSKTIKFYSPNEISTLREMKSMPKKERSEALKAYCTGNARSFVGAYAKMMSLKAKKAYTPRKAAENRVTFSGKEVVVPFKSLSIRDNNLIFEL